MMRILLLNGLKASGARLEIAGRVEWLKSVLNRLLIFVPADDLFSAGTSDSDSDSEFIFLK
jgi:hypothetical protein